MKKHVVVKTFDAGQRTEESSKASWTREANTAQQRPDHKNVLPIEEGGCEHLFRNGEKIYENPIFYTVSRYCEFGTVEDFVMAADYGLPENIA